MRGDAERQANIMLAVTPDSFIPDDHPIRRIKPIVDSALQQLSGLFDTMYSTSGRPSIPPEHLLKASLLIALYSNPQRAPGKAVLTGRRVRDQSRRSIRVTG